VPIAGPNYAEFRQWVRWLRAFTPSEIAEVMAIHPQLAERFIKAGLWHEMIEDTGIRLNGAGPEEAMYRWIKLPSGPREHFRTWAPEWKPEVTPGCYSLAPRNRGMPVRIRSDKDRRRAGSKPGEGHRMRMNELAYQRHQEAIQKRKDAQKSKAHKEPKWKRQK
jgi:hypothetical protein